MKTTNQRCKYQNHIFPNLNEIIKDLEATESSDGKKMFSTLYPVIIKLQDKKINVLKNINAVFKDCGFNCKNTGEMISFLLQKLDVDSDIRKRVIRKMNNSHRNVIFNYLFNDFSDRIIILIDEFVTKNCPNIHNHNFLIDQLKLQIKPKNDEIDMKTKINISNETSNQIFLNHTQNISEESKIIDYLNNSSLSLLDFKEEDDFSEFIF